MTAAITDPVSYVRMVASLMPREIEATITPVTERMSTAQLEAIIAQDIEGDLDPAATDEDAQIIQYMGALLRRQACAASHLLTHRLRRRQASS
jgi:hypothetical protein